jgi:hypothetical protein
VAGPLVLASASRFESTWPPGIMMLLSIKFCHGAIPFPLLGIRMAVSEARALMLALAGRDDSHGIRSRIG